MQDQAAAQRRRSQELETAASAQRVEHRVELSRLHDLLEKERAEVTAARQEAAELQAALQGLKADVHDAEQDRDVAESATAAAIERANTAESQLAALRYDADDATARKRRREVRDAGAAADEYAREFSELRQQAEHLRHHAFVRERVAELELKLAEARQSSRQSAAQLGISKHKAARDASVVVDERQLKLRELRTEKWNLMRKVQSLQQQLGFLHQYPHVEQVRGKGAADELELKLPLWEELDGTVQLPQFSARAPYGVQRQRQDGMGACGGEQVHCLLLLLAAELAGKYRVGWERTLEVVATVLQRLRICELVRLPSRAQMALMGKACHKLNLLVCGRRLATKSHEGAKCWGGDGSSVKKRTVIASTVWWKSLCGATKLLQLGVRYAYRETGEAIKDHAVKDLQLLEANATEALQLTHEAVHGCAMDEMQVRVDRVSACKVHAAPAVSPAS